MFPAFTDLQMLTPYGATMVLALLVAWFWARRRAPSFGLDASHVDLALPLASLIGVVGTSLLAPDNAVRLIAVIGFGALTVFIYSLVWRVSFLRLVDTMALPTLAIIAIQRVGCFLAGCCWGKVSSAPDHAWTAVSYPPGSFPYEQQAFLGQIPTGAEASLSVYPLQLYESLLVLLVLLVLRRIDTARLSPGTLALISTVAYCALRFFTEFLRGDTGTVWQGLTVVQLQIVVLLAIAAAVSIGSIRNAR